MSTLGDAITRALIKRQEQIKTGMPSSQKQKMDEEEKKESPKTNYG